MALSENLSLSLRDDQKDASIINETTTERSRAPRVSCLARDRSAFSFAAEALATAATTAALRQFESSCFEIKCEKRIDSAALI